MAREATITPMKSPGISPVSKTCPQLNPILLHASASAAIAAIKPVGKGLLSATKSQELPTPLTMESLSYQLRLGRKAYSSFDCCESSLSLIWADFRPSVWSLLPYPVIIRLSGPKLAKLVWPKAERPWSFPGRNPSGNLPKEGFQRRVASH